jgi:hypothetical protein
MRNNLEEYITRDDSEIAEEHNSSDSEDVDSYINNELATHRNKSRERPRI